MTANLLGAVVEAARQSAHERERLHQAAELERRAGARRPDGAAFAASLRRPGVRVIAECKRRSPSRGILRVDYDAASIARGYELAGAAAISVLTEPTFFDGSLADLEAVRAAVSVPILRKDFVVTEYQILEAAACGADAVLLIVAALDDATLDRLVRHARALGLAALVEVHDRPELQRALDAGADVVGVNSRDLRTLALRPALLDEIGGEIPAGIVAVAESGLKTAEDLERLRRVRYDGFLIGERFMTMADPGAALAALRASAAELQS